MKEEEEEKETEVVVIDSASEEETETKTSEGTTLRETLVRVKRETAEEMKAGDGTPGRGKRKASRTKERGVHAKEQRRR